MERQNVRSIYADVGERLVILEIETPKNRQTPDGSLSYSVEIEQHKPFIDLQVDAR
jgi:hypothetical protein